MAFDEDELEPLFEFQGGVVSRRQLRELDAHDHDIRRLVRQRRLTQIHPGVYVSHTGVPTWGQRAWAAVLYCWPAALTGSSALPREPRNEAARQAAPIEVMVAMTRTVRAPAGVIVRPNAHFEEQVDWLAYPPSQELVPAAIDAAARRPSANDAFTLLADLVQRRHVRASALAKAVRRRPRLRNRALLGELIDDLAAGACSVLEREYLRLERKHGLPRGSRQVGDDAGGTSVERDVTYADFGLVVELDGRAFHDNAKARDADARRDLAAAVHRDLRSVRLTYGQMLDSPCQTIAAVAALLRAGGWSGAVRRCPTCPAQHAV